MASLEHPLLGGAQVQPPQPWLKFVGIGIVASAVIALTATIGNQNGQPISSLKVQLPAARYTQTLSSVTTTSPQYLRRGAPLQVPAYTTFATPQYSTVQPTLEEETFVHRTPSTSTNLPFWLIPAAGLVSLVSYLVGSATNKRRDSPTMLSPAAMHGDMDDTHEWHMATTVVPGPTAQELGGAQPNEVEICEFTQKALRGENEEHDLLLRAARGEKTSRPPVWLMRQAGRYMPAFRAYSEKFPFRQRSETPEMAIAMSLQPWHAFGTDGVIMFSDILTPWPVFGVEFDVVRGKGPQIPEALNSVERMEAVKSPNTPEEFAEKLPFIKEILGTLRKETEGKSTLIGFVGSPFTLVAYAMEGGGSKNCEVALRLMQNEPEACKVLLTKVAEGIAAYSAYQVSCGAQVLQVFESWAHQLSPALFEEFAKPFAELCIKKIKERCPDTPVIYFANGGSGFLENQKDMSCDMLCLDWKCDMAQARKTLGEDRAVSGNVDPRILHSGTEEQIRQAVRDCAQKAKGTPFVLNVGHGVMQGTPESSVFYFCDEAKKVQL